LPLDKLGALNFVFSPPVGGSNKIGGCPDFPLYQILENIKNCRKRYLLESIELLSELPKLFIPQNVDYFNRKTPH